MTVLVKAPETASNETSANADWSDWDRWLRSHLAVELKTLHSALGKLLATERHKFEHKADALELKIAQLTGAVDILRGAVPPPPAKFPSVMAYRADLIYHKDEIVTFAGSTYQATKETAHAPPSPEWTCLAAAGAGLTIRGTYDVYKKYQKLDVVIINGSSFAALKDNPGPCPDSGDWHLLASRGSRGQRGAEGARGLMGPRGERGAPAPTIQSWLIDRARYTATPMMTDGSIGSTLELRGLFEQFQLETKG